MQPRYTVIKRIGKGGMGEVFLVYDSVCCRQVALKKMREDLRNREQLKKRFLREATIAAKLTHPGVVPVYTICSDTDPVYYTMPYIKGDTLKTRLKSAWNKEFLSKKLEEKTSIQYFLSVFEKICLTLEYVHSQGILHRDLKPDNIFLGLFGEVVILDWGAAVSQNKVSDASSEFLFDFEKVAYTNMTVHGKLVGTPDYMAPERLCGGVASESTEVYALGVILYQMLTLSFPYHCRSKGKQFSIGDMIIPPEERAPYREISPFLSQIVMKALSKSPKDRYSSVKELRCAIEQYLQGNPEWIIKKALFFQKQECWELRETILLSKYFPSLYVSTTLWFHLLISKLKYVSEVRVECSVQVEALFDGFGLLLPLDVDQEQFHKGYGFWMYARDNMIVVLLIKNGVEIQQVSKLLTFAPSDYLSIVLEQYAHKLSLKINQQEWLLHIDYLPQCGKRVGFVIHNIEHLSNSTTIYESSSNLRVSCLAVPDAFLLEKLYDHAIPLYRRISESFPGRREGCEAQFRLGIALLDKSKETLQQADLSLAFEAFSVLHDGPLAPLEYLGKALIYQQQHNEEEEIRTLVFALKRYSNHPEINRLYDYVNFRLHESLHKRTKDSLTFMLLTIHSLSRLVSLHEIAHLFSDRLNKISMSTIFCSSASLQPLRSTFNEVLLSYWSGCTLLFPIFFQTYLNQKNVCGLAQLFYVASDLGHYDFVQQYTDTLQGYLMDEELGEEETRLFSDLYQFVLSLQAFHQEKEPEYFILKTSPYKRLWLDLFVKKMFLLGRAEQVLHILRQCAKEAQDAVYRQYIELYTLWCYLWLKDTDHIDQLFIEYNIESWSPDRSFILRGYRLAVFGEVAQLRSHFQKCNERTMSPETLISVYFAWGLCETSLSYQEQRCLLFQKYLLYHCLGDFVKRDEARIKYMNLASVQFA